MSASGKLRVRAMFTPVCVFVCVCVCGGGVKVKAVSAGCTFLGYLYCTSPNAICCFSVQRAELWCILEVRALSVFYYHYQLLIYK